MYNMYEVIIYCIMAILMAFALTPLVRRLAFKLGAVDYPNQRRVNTQPMPSLGGLAIYVTFFFIIFFLQPIQLRQSLPLFIAATIVVATGLIDDIKEISPKAKLLGIVIAALFIVLINDLTVARFTLPLIGPVNLPFWLGLPATLLWVVAITNAINLVDGLDGLASGVSAIALTTMGLISFFFLGANSYLATILIYSLVGSILGFLPWNFNPARIYLGDTGALFLGFMISVFSLYSLKNVTLVSLIIPIVILGMPITDTVYAMLRRKLNKKPISSADKNHMHHRLMSLGLTHRQTVLFIYAIAAIFSITALLYPISSYLGNILITLLLLLGVEIFVEMIGLVGEDRRPLVKTIRAFARKINRKGKKNHD
ncbi:Phospho-N-acetylmuramoyl-pentapeptide-transferase [Alloiococcus otitis]|uniref:UDP-N-acetylglucosamine:undecaprenyl-P N-acetylglucosaminyl 1-P transferase n=2 Tax=Alloiococcus TaxID=1651 RepID=K9EUX2_9LACT|nr:MraY family glycosyltransferase [Alloiococcus otitis]EKU92995.1 hypothetical protein HMPREF9698_01301 [Alloiococcus otitis ATCC 51267]SUU80857.1 Phospho-N-acetylmuramoyl-pentapeptide-transferase [Alloiococcus otitis]